MTRPIVICDLDGTLSDASHRQHLVQGRAKDFDRFYDLCDLDLPKREIIELLFMISAHYDIFILSGRSSRVRDKTVDWLDQHGVTYNGLFMRPEGNYTPDHELKQEMLTHLLESCNGNIEDVLFTIDDRDRVVDMWRSLGLTCLQVAPGDF